MPEIRTISLRLPVDVYEQLANLAKRDIRSINAELIVLIREASK